MRNPFAPKNEGSYWLLIEEVTMRHPLRWRSYTILCGALLVLFSVQWSLTAQAPVKRPLSYDVFDYWRSIGGTRLSADGQWLAYALTSQGEDGELVVRNLKSGQELRQPRGNGPMFTPDGKFLIFTIAPPKADEAAQAEQAAAATTPEAGQAPAGGRGPGGRGAGSASRNGMGILTLPDGKVTVTERISSFRLPEESSTWLAYQKAAAGAGGRGGRGGGRAGGGVAGVAGAPAAAAPATQAAGAQAAPGAPREKRKDPGTDLILRNLVSGEETTIAEVTDYQWNKDGSWLVYGVSSAKPEGDGAFARKMSDGSVTTLHKGRGNYRNLSFDDAGRQVAFLSDQVEYEKEVSPYRLYYWKVDDAEATELVSGGTRGMPAGRVVSENAAPRFSRDGARLFLGTAPPPAPPAAPGVKAPLRVDLWSYKDPLLQPNQQNRANQDRTRNFSAVVSLNDKRFVQLATPDLPAVNPGENAARALGTSGIPYQQEISWDTSYNDVFLVDIQTGTSRKILEHYNGSMSLSPGANYVLYFDEPSGHWFTYRIADGTRTNLTAKLPVKFANQTHDTPDLPPTIGSAGWSEGDKSVLLYDEFDIWEIRPDGTGARMVTNGEGRKQNLVFRYRPIDDGTSVGGGGRGGVGGGGRGGGGGAERPIPANKPLLLATTNDGTRASGYYRVNLTGTAAPEKIIMMDKMIGAPTKAKNADVVVFTESRFDEFPDLWVSDTNFTTPKKVSNANPQQAEFIWGKAEKMQYTNGDGKRLDALLIKPENFDPAKKYPLMVYIYEELSDGLHGYRAPNVGTSINVTRYVSNGYIILEPDIVYETGYPGQSAMKCVIPAINTLVAQGYIDPKRIGIQGHSWGGYQITYMITQTNIFAAVEAGASVSNMISAYGGIRWGTGVVRQMQYEKGQSRIGAPPWDAPLQYIENSPIFWVERIRTPYLTIHNDGDTAVPWQQGIEFNTALRRLGKEAYMFNFNGEAHSLGNRDNQKYFTVHMDEFFDHYLLGKPRPEWMDKGVSFLERGTRDVSPLFKKMPVVSPAPSDKK
jgi:dipeptidyl aminopeptidase/acylaminoacyl peptidase